MSAAGELPELEEIRAELRARLRALCPEVDASPETSIGKLLDAAAVEILEENRIFDERVRPWIEASAKASAEYVDRMILEALGR